MLDYALIHQALTRLSDHRVVTPLLEYPLINEMLGGRVLFKAENLQKTGSFKFRGAFNKIASLEPSQRERGVVAYSSGNHAQGVAAAAQLFSIDATVVMPTDAPLLKRRNTEKLGARLVLYDQKTEDRKAIAEGISAKTGAIIVPPYDDEMVMAGQGTIGIEIVTQLRMSRMEADFLLCPVGGGGLMAGISTVLRSLMPSTQLYCVEPEGFDDTRRSLEQGRRLANHGSAISICDAIITPMPGEMTFPVNLANLDGGFAVEESAIISAVDMLFEMAKLVVEPGGAVGLAALLANKLELQGRTVVIILSGGNMDLGRFRAQFKVL